MSLIKKIKDYYKKDKRLLFTTPSHLQGNFVTPGTEKILGNTFFRSDFSEIEGFDNLRAPEGVLKTLQTNISKIYKSKASFMLTNGSTSGILAAMLSILKDKDKVLIARNCHISVYNGLVLTGAEPTWFLPEYDSKWGIYKGADALDIKKHFKEHRDIKAVIITSPTYEGLFSDIEGISKVCKKNNAKLIVDEAHGALLNFGEFKAKTAILSGADISIQSLHKTAGAPNPCALIHLAKHSDIPSEKVQESLNLINTTSPSYPLLCAIEAAVAYLNSNKGKKHIVKLFKNLNNFKLKLSSIADFYEGFNDQSKLLIKLKNKDGLESAEILNEKFLIEEEFSTSKAMLFITGIGTDKRKLDKLNSALKKVFQYVDDEKSRDITEGNFILPAMHLNPKEAFNAPYEIIDTEKARGRISAELIISYPPGIPIIFPGEEITLDSLFKIEKSRIKVLK